MSAQISLSTIKHGFKPLPANAAICKECEGAIDDPLHSVPATKPGLAYPLHYNSLSLNGPTLFYIDQEGSPIQLGLNNREAQMVIDQWNAQARLESEESEKPLQLKPAI